MPLKAAIVPVTPFQQNCTLLWDEDSKRGVVVDPGGDLDRIQAGAVDPLEESASLTALRRHWLLLKGALRGW